MTQEIIYEYLGTNGILRTPIHLEGIYSVKKVRLTASEGKLLTKNNKIFEKSVIVPWEDVELWYEV